MKSIIKRFEAEEVRIFDSNGNPWFVAADVCKVLGITNPTEALRGVDSDDLSTTEAIDSIGRRTRFNIVNESGLYQLIFKSRKPEARKFKRWVTSEVLPSIRRTGTYSIPERLRKISTEKRNQLTDAWKDCGISSPGDYARLTVEEYRCLQFEYGKRKKDMNKDELLLLSALESMEALNLHYNPAKGYLECKESLVKTSNTVKAVTDARQS